MRRSPFLQDFGTLLRKARLRTGLSQEQLAARAKMHQVSVSALESGRQAPS